MNSSANIISKESINSQLIAKVRSETSEKHLMLEKHPLSKKLLNENISQEDYVNYLACMNEVYSAYEYEILPLVKNFVPEYQYLPKANAIKEDLNYFRQKKVNIPVISKFKFNFSRDKNYLLGLAYVIEGSSLGGRVILKHVQKNLHLDENSGASFFFGHGGNTGIHWMSFLELISNNIYNESEENELIKGASSAFASIYDHFNNNAHLV